MFNRLIIMSTEIPCTSSRNAPLQNSDIVYLNEDGSCPPPRRPSSSSRSRILFSSLWSPSERRVRWSVDCSRSRSKQLSATAKRHEGNRLETTSGGGSGGHEEIASLPSNDVTTNANLITGPDIANRPGPVAAVVWGVS